MSTTINAPSKTANGTSWFGPVELEFKDGAATYDGDLPDGIRAYLQGAGYGIDAAATEPEAAPEPPDLRDTAITEVGSPARDAAVDPQPVDFLPPTNAGQANPHGPDVVSPGIHALETKAVVPGLVGSPERQQERETKLAEDTLAGDRPVPEATVALADDADTDGKPAGNASEDKWREYAVNHGVPADEAEGLSRNQLRDRFTD